MFRYAYVHNGEVDTTMQIEVFSEELSEKLRKSKNNEELGYYFLQIIEDDENKSETFYFKKPPYLIAEEDRILNHYEYVLKDNIDEIKQDVLANARWQLQDGGFLYDNYFVRTDEDSKNNYTAKVIQIDAGKTGDTIEWKFADGFADIDKDIFIELTDAVYEFTTRCFTVEREIRSTLDSIAMDESAIASAFLSRLRSSLAIRPIFIDGKPIAFVGFSVESENIEETDNEND